MAGALKEQPQAQPAPPLTQQREERRGQRDRGAVHIALNAKRKEDVAVDSTDRRAKRYSRSEDARSCTTKASVCVHPHAVRRSHVTFAGTTLLH